jgi:tetratricopeptide (TPR) repeat protein
MPRLSVSPAVRILIFSTALASLVTPANAQLSARALLQNSVDTIDDRFQDVADAIVLFRDEKNPTAALSLLRKAAREHSEIPPAEVMYAHLCFGASQVDAGRAVLEIAAVNAEDDPEPWIMLADLAMRASRLAEADVLFEKGLEKTAYLTENVRRQQYLSVNAHAGLARLDERRGQWTKAEVHLRRWLELQPDNPDALRRLAAACFSQKKYDESIGMLQKIREKDANQPLPEVVMGILHQKNGQREQASEMMQAALTKASDDPATRMAVAEWALTVGRIRMAKENAAAVLEMNADAVRAEILLGRAQRFEGDNEGAESIFRTVCEKVPASFIASNELALTLLAINDPEKHRQAVQYAQVNAGRYKDIRTAVGQQAAATLAYGLHQIDQTAAADRIIQQVITSGEVSPQTGYFAAVIFKKRGHNDVARQLLQKSLSSYIAFPEQQSAKQLLEELQTDAESQGPGTVFEPPPLLPETQSE